MLYRLIGPAKSGKTEYLLRELEQIVKNGGSCVWLTSEHHTADVEKMLLDRLGDSANLSVEVLSFKRLPERVAHVFGGLHIRYPDKGALCALLSILSEEHKNELLEYGASVSDEAFISGLLSFFGKLRSEMITPEKLKTVSESGSASEGRLGRKLHDFAILYRAYDDYFTENTRDERDALSVLASELADKPFFAQKTVFVDDHYTFTGQEFALLIEIMKQANALYCTFTYDGREFFESGEKAAFRLARFADRFEDINVGPYKGSKRDELKFLEKELWADETPTFTGEKGGVRILSAADPFAEANAVASEILRLVRSGLRYRDIAVLARNLTDYTGILDAVLGQNRIPFFFTEKEEVLTHPLVAFVLAALEVIDTNYSLFSIRKYIKTGFSGLPAEDGDLLLRYAESWNLRSKDWTNDCDWTKNPDGYREGEMDEEQRAFLSAVNRARKQLTSSIRPLYEELKRKDRTVDTMLCALYSHLERVGAGERFTSQANRLLSEGDEEGARIHRQVWVMISGVFDRIHDLCGNRKMTVSRLLQLLKLTFGAYSIGTIPSSLDSVSIDDPATFHGGQVKAVILMGCNDGIFPATISNDPLFDEYEALLLEGEEINVVESRLSKLTSERYFFYSAITAPSEQLIFTYPNATLSGEMLRVSPAIMRVKALLPHLTESYFDDSPVTGLYSAESAANIFPLLPDGADKERLKELLTEKGLMVSSTPMPVTDSSAQIRFRGESLRLSASKVERYRLCPFSYFGESVMHLKEKKRNRFSTPEIGTFIHRILEIYLAEHTKTGRFIPPENEQELEKEAEALTRDCFASVFGSEGAGDKRLLRTFRNLKKTLVLMLSDLAEEFNAGSFLPIGFEVGIGMGDHPLPAVEFRTDEGKRVYFIGSIDRVDAYDKDGVRYIRVVDYKTYKKDFSLDYIEQYGLDEQMLLYLFAYCKNAAKDGEVLLPAGILYDQISLPFAEITGEETEQEIRDRLIERLGRTGLVLEDDEIADAMDPNHTKHYLPVSYDKNGLKPGKNTLTAERFIELEKLLEKQLHELADAVFDGDMDVRPLRLGEHYDACRYCKFRTACRRKGESENA